MKHFYPTVSIIQGKRFSNCYLHAIAYGEFVSSSLYYPCPPMSALPCLHDYDKDHKILHSQSCFPLVKTFVEMKQRLSTCFDYLFEPKSSDIFLLNVS